MWFDEIMDDCKLALRVANKNKGVFIPIFISAAIYILLFITFILSASMFFISNIESMENLLDNTENLLAFIIPAGLIVLGLYLFLIAVWTMLEVGSVNLYKYAVEGIPLKIDYFFEGIKKYFFRVFTVAFILNSLLLLLSPLILLIFVSYTVTIGILTAGWGVLIISVVIGTFMNLWVIALVTDNLGGFKALTASVRIGKKYFLGLFTLTLSSMLISQYFSGAFGTLIALIAGWFLSSVIITYFKLVFVLVYKRNRKVIA